MPRSSKRARAATLVGPLALALQHLDGDGGLAILECSEVLRAGHRQRAVAGDDFFGQTAQGLDTQRQRNHVQQQPVVTAVAGQRIGLQGGADGHHGVRVQIRQRRAAEKLTHRGTDGRHARGAADQHHAGHLIHRDAGIAQRPPHRRQGAGDQIGGQRLEVAATECEVQYLPAGQAVYDGNLRAFAERLLGRPGEAQQRLALAGRRRVQVRLGRHPVGHHMIEIIAAERGVAIDRQHLEHPAGQAQHGNVEGAATQIVDRVHALGGLIQTVGQRGSGRFGQQAQHLDAGQARGVLGGLALRLVEIGRHGDDRADQLAAQGGLGALAQAAQDLRRHLDRALDAAGGSDLHHARGVQQPIRGPDGDVTQAAPHQALDRGDGVGRIVRQGGARRGCRR